MKTLADLKRRITIGTRLQCVENTLRPVLNNTSRVVVKTQTNGFWWVQDGIDRRSWTDYPKATLCTWVDEDTVQLGFDTRHQEHYVRLAFLTE